MSATNRKQGVKSPNEFYRTPAFAVAALLRSLPELAEIQNGRWLEPSAGDGAIIKAVGGFGYTPIWTAVELRHECFEALRDTGIPARNIHIGNPYQWFTAHKKFDLSLGNPPFTQAVEFVDQGLRDAKRVIMLNRLNWLGPKERVNWFRNNPPAIKIISPRPFPDATEYAWFCWGVGTLGTWEIIN